MTVKFSHITKGSEQPKFRQDAVTKQMGARLVTLRVRGRLIRTPMNTASYEKAKNDPNWINENADNLLAAREVREYSTENVPVAPKGKANDVRKWAIKNGYEVGARGRFSRNVIEAYNEAHKG